MFDIIERIKMISISIPSSRDGETDNKKYFPAVVTTNGIPHSYYNTHKKGDLSIISEVVKRQSIIDSILLNFPHKVDDVVTLKNITPNFGYKIVNIIRNYSEMKEDWSPSNNPMLLSLTHKDSPNELILCSCNAVLGVA